MSLLPRLYSEDAHQTTEQGELRKTENGLNLCQADVVLANMERIPLNIRFDLDFRDKALDTALSRYIHYGPSHHGASNQEDIRTKPVTFLFP